MTGPLDDKVSPPVEESGADSDFPPKAADRMAGQINRSRHGLQQACRQTEADFLGMGERLQAIASEADRLAQIARNAVDRIGTEADATVFEEIIRIAYQALDEFTQEQAGMTERTRFIRSICDHLRGLGHLPGGLGRIAKDLKMVAININIESSRNAESRDSFRALSQEIRNLSETVASLSQTLKNEVETITTKLERVQQVVGTNLKQLTQLADDARCVADQATPACRALMERSVDMLQTMQTNGAAISTNTGQLVVNLQIHDNVSQRVAHIAEALDDACKFLQPPPASDMEPIDRQRAVAAADAHLDLQQAQLTDIITDIDTVYTGSTGAFKIIGDRVRDTTAGIVQFDRGGGTPTMTDAGDSGSMDALKTAIEKIKTLIGQGHAVLEEIQSISHDATEAVTRIADHVQRVKDVNFDIHLKSLNAFFKSTQLGNRGRAISVLVQEMKTLATQSNDLVEQVESTNGAIVDQANQLQAHLQTAGNPNLTAVSSTELEAAMQAFFESTADFTRHADTMAALSQTLDEQIAAAEDKLAFLNAFADTLRAHQEQLADYRTQLAPWITDAGAAAFDKTRLAERYTMEQERIIHTSVLEGVPTAGTTEPVAGQEAHHQGEADDLGDNVELF